MSDYIENAQKYTLLKQDRDYMLLVKSAHQSKAYSAKELQNALRNENIHPLSDILRIIAYDEISDSENISIHIDNITYNDQLLKRYPPFALLIADILLRTGNNDKLLLLLPREEIVMLPEKQKQQAYYYRAMAKYLSNEEISEEFEMIKNHFEQTKEIYYKNRKRAAK